MSEDMEFLKNEIELEGHYSLSIKKKDGTTDTLHEKYIIEYDETCMCVVKKIKYHKWNDGDWIRPSCDYETFNLAHLAENTGRIENDIDDRFPSDVSRIVFDIKKNKLSATGFYDLNRKPTATEVKAFVIYLKTNDRGKYDSSKGIYAIHNKLRSAIRYCERKNSNTFQYFSVAKDEIIPSGPRKFECGIYNLKGVYKKRIGISDCLFELYPDTRLAFNIRVTDTIRNFSFFTSKSDLSIIKVYVSKAAKGNKVEAKLLDYYGFETRGYILKNAITLIESKPCGQNGAQNN